MPGPLLIFVSSVSLSLTFGLFYVAIQWPVLLHALVGPVALSAELLLVACSLQMSLAGRQFLRDVRVLETEEDVDRYRRLVWRLMYGAVVWGALVSVTGVLVSFSLVVKEMSGAIGLLALAAFLFKTFELVTVEERLQSIATASEQARHDRDQIVAAWKSQMLPRW